MMVSFVLFVFPRSVLNLIESVSEGFPSYFYIWFNKVCLICLFTSSVGCVGVDPVCILVLNSSSLCSNFLLNSLNTLLLLVILSLYSWVL